MSLRTGEAWNVFGASVPNTNRHATQVTVLTDEHPPTSKVAFFVPAEGRQPAPGDALSWGTNHVDCTPPGAATFRLHKIGFDFDPDAPLH